MSKLKLVQPHEVSPAKIKAVIFGKSGAGKTYLGLSFPSPVIIDVEAGATRQHYVERLKKSQGAYFGVDEGSQDFDAVIEQVKALATEKHPYKTLVIDSITKLQNIVLAQEIERLGDKDSFGASKKKSIAYTRRLIRWLSKLDMNIFLIAHEATLWGMVGDQRTEIGVQPDCMAEQCKLIYELDLTLQVRPHSAKRRDVLVYKTRLESFPANDAIIIQDNGIDKCYDEIATRYGKEAIESTVNLITLATPEQVENINKLFAILQMTEEQQTKLLGKANVETPDELETEKATQLIDHLKKQTEI